VYEIEQILDMRLNPKGKTEYLVKWKGWETEDNTWEPTKHLRNCKDMIEAFEQ